MTVTVPPAQAHGALLCLAQDLLPVAVGKLPVVWLAPCNPTDPVPVETGRRADLAMDQGIQSETCTDIACSALPAWASERLRVPCWQLARLCGSYPGLNL